MNNWLVSHIASGQAFFSGAGLVLFSVLARHWGGRIARRCVPVAFIVGVILVALSSAPLPAWLYALVTAATTAWLISLRWFKRWQNKAAIVAAVLWIGCVAAEIPFHLMPRLQPAAARAVSILGDSVTAGLEEKEAETWPKLLARAHRVEVQDLSHVGEIASSSLKRVRKQRLKSSLVIVEIGGNDLLGFTSAPQFATDLEALLQYLSEQNCQVVMLELPLPPFYHAYGRAQRVLARKYGAALVPKRVFLQILATDNSTLDSIHLSQTGHQLMADRMWEIVGPAMPE